jgi:hypothetical protein
MSLPGSNSISSKSSVLPAWTICAHSESSRSTRLNGNLRIQSATSAAAQA